MNDRMSNKRLLKEICTLTLIRNISFNDTVVTAWTADKTVRKDFWTSSQGVREENEKGSNITTKKDCLDHRIGCMSSADTLCQVMLSMRHITLIMVKIY